MKNIIETFAVAVTRCENWVNGRLDWNLVDSDLHLDHSHIDADLFNRLAEIAEEIVATSSIIAPTLMGSTPCNEPLTSTYAPNELIVKCLEVGL
jgi:3-methyladenine DNA glycosylase AlkD